MQEQREWFLEKESTAEDSGKTVSMTTKDSEYCRKLADKAA